MKPRGPLMIEHRLIEAMIGLIQNELGRMEKDRRADPDFVEIAVDFIRTYADLTHHGKEEDILFQVLAQKEMSDHDKSVLKELIREHIYGRETVKALEAANRRYASGDATAIDEIIARLKALVNFYPQHIQKEDKDFFPSTEKYLDAKEREKLLLDFKEFDRKMIHKKYEAVIKTLEEEKNP